MTKGGDKKNACDFCAVGPSNKQFVRETTYFKVLHNIFPYSIWDYQAVIDHLLVVPKKHTDSLAGISQKAANEYIKVLTSYENKGYCVYARAPKSVMKSVPHQHTHLIRLSNKRIKGLLYLEKPHIRLLIK